MRDWLGQHIKIWAVTFLCIVVAWSTTKILSRRGALGVPTFMVYDALLRNRFDAPSTQPTGSTCVVVGLEENDIQRWGQYPISDYTMANLLERILDCKPAAIGLDIYRDIQQMDHNRIASANADRHRLEQILLNNYNIIAPQFIGPSAQFEVSAPKVMEAAPLQVGTNDVKKDADGVIRRAILSDSDRHGHTLYSVPVLLASLALPESMAFGESDDKQQFLLGKTIYPRFKLTSGPYADSSESEPQSFQTLVDYRAPRDVTEVSASRVLDQEHPISPDFFANKVVLIGLWTQSVKDFVNTPWGNDYYGVAFHAAVTDQLIRAAYANGVPNASGAPLRQWGFLAQNAWLALFCTVGAVIAWVVRPPGRYFAGIIGMSMVGISAGAVLAGLAAVVIGSFQSNLWIPSVPPLAGFIIAGTLVTVYSSVNGRLDRRAMMKLFSWCVAEDVAKEIWKHRESVFANGELKPRRMRATILFTDLVGFSKRAEKLTPEELMIWLKKYFEAMASVVNSNHGNINKFNGDQIVAVFGPPIKHNLEEAAEDARNAVTCSLQMRDELMKFNREHCEPDSPTGMRVGIHSGWVVAGSLGTRGRLEWTVIGNDVNVAARLESTHKTKMNDQVAQHGCRILISGRTRKLLNKAFDTKFFGCLQLKGIDKPMRTYSVKARQVAEQDATPDAKSDANPPTVQSEPAIPSLQRTTS